MWRPERVHDRRRQRWRAASGGVRVDGSSTVAPLTAAAKELFNATPEGEGVDITVGQSGTGGGFKKFCAGETDISDASRSIKDEEAAACAEAGIEYAEIAVANDALTLIVNNENDWAKCLTVAELNTMWAPESEGKVTNWNQVNPSFPDVPLELFGAGTDSGTFDYFTDVINGEEGASRTDYTPSEDDNITLTGVEGTKGALGYLGFSYFEENADKVKAVEVDGGNGCVAPSLESASDGTYTPLSPAAVHLPVEVRDAASRGGLVRRVLRDQRRRDHQEGTVRPAERGAGGGGQGCAGHAPVGSRWLALGRVSSIDSMRQEEADREH